MLIQPKISGKRLADLCHRLAISTESGIDIRRTWQREADNASGAISQSFRTVDEGIASGDTLAEAIHRTGGLFPRLFREMVQVGEKTGSLAEVLHKLSSHYLHRHQMARALRVRLTWPALQLGAAVFIIGVMIAVLGMLDLKVDILGLGVTGMRALTVYIQIIIGIVFTIAALVFAAKQGLLTFGPLERLVMSSPGLGTALQKICLARLAWALHLTLNVEMDLRQLVPLALRATGSDYYTRWSKQITSLVAAGSPLSEAFDAAGIFPIHFIESLQVAEESGQFVESMGRLSDQYEDEAERAMETLNTIFGFMLGIFVLVILGFMVVRLFQAVYINPINEALQGI